MYVATRGLYRMKPPTIIVPKCIKEDVEQLFEVHRRMDQSELKHNLIGLDVGNGWSSIEFFYQLKILVSFALVSLNVILSKLIKRLFPGEEFHLRRDLKVRAFKTYHVIPSQVS
jgi:ribonuclease Z